MSYIVAVAARWTKSLKLTLSIAVHRGGLAKNDFWLVAKQKKRIGEQLNYFLNMCPKPFSWAKNKRKLFSDGKSRGPLLARVALRRGYQHPSNKFETLWQVAQNSFSLLLSYFAAQYVLIIVVNFFF